MSDEKHSSSNVLYLHGRPGPHPLHEKFARAVTADHVFIDQPIRWQDQNKGSIYDFFAWVVNALFFKNSKKYDIFLVDNLHVTCALIRLFGKIKKKQKLVVHLGSHTLYFMHSRVFGKLNLWLHKFALGKYDALICEGQMAAELARLLMKEKCPPIYTTFLGPLETRSSSLKKITPNLKGHTILVIASGPAQFRMYYKGLDIMISAFKEAYLKNPKLELIILGQWNEDIKLQLLENIHIDIRSKIFFEGAQSHIEPYLQKASLCLHCSRGDAFPTSTIETLAAGVPTIISEWTGTKEIINKIDPQLIVPLNIELITDKILWYFNLPLADKQKLSDSGRDKASGYTEENAVNHYRETFQKISHDLGIERII